MDTVTVGGKHPTLNKRGSSPPPLTILVLSGSSGDTDDKDSYTQEEAQFHDQDQTCSDCEHFEAAERECEKGVDVDFSESDPAKSWCHFWGKKEGHSFSCVMADMPDDIADAILKYGKSIPDEDCNIEEAASYGGESCPDGRESACHVTVKYGIHSESPTETKKLVSSQPPLLMRLGRTGIFENEEADVLFVSVDSEDLEEMNALISDNVKVTDTHKDYKPHVTVAYLKSGCGKKYKDQDIPGATGKSFEVDSVQFSSKTKEVTTIQLKG